MLLIQKIAECALLLAMALLGLWVNWWFLMVGLVLHGGWDFLHHDKSGQTQRVVPRWYVPFCALYDATLAVFVALYLAIRS